VADATVIALVEPSALPLLRNFDLSHNHIAEAGLEALAHSPLLRRLGCLWLGSYGRGVPGRYLSFARVLAEQPGPVLLLNRGERDADNPALREMLGERLVLWE
jgi:hypothetical protein